METKEILERQISSKRKIKALIFDFGGVLNTSNDAVSWNKGFQALGAKNNISMEIEPCKSIIADYAVGKYASDNVFITTLREILDIPEGVSAEDIKAAWNNQVLSYNEELYKLIEYKKQFKLFGLSNTNKMHRDYFEGILYPRYINKHPDKNLPKSFRDMFDKVYCSHEIFCKKPNPEAWKVILKDNPGLLPEECIFIDDIKDYVDAAAALGMHVFQFDITKHSFDDVMKLVAEINASADIEKTNTKAMSQKTVEYTKRVLTISTNEFKKFATEQDLKKLLAVLSAKKIPYQLDDNAKPTRTGSGLGSGSGLGLAPSSAASLSLEKKIKKELKTVKTPLYEDEVFKLFLMQTPGLSGCFIFEPKSLSQYNVRLFDISVTAFIASLKKQGFLQYSISQNQNDKSIKLIPIPDAGCIVDINRKIINSLRSFFGENAVADFDSLPSLASYTTPQKDKSLDDVRFPRRSFWVKIDELAHNMHKSIMAFLVENNITPMDAKEIAEAMAPKTSPKTIPTALAGQAGTEVGVATKKLQRDNPSCAFCIEDVVKKQLVLDVGHFLILVNYQPYMGTKAHFLIVPKHIEDWSHLDQDQKDSLEKIVNAVTKSIQTHCGVSKKDILSHVQNGVTAGQTVSGSHLHLMTTPKFLPFLIDMEYQLIGQRTNSLTAEEMAGIAEKFKPEILQSLWSECSPAKFVFYPNGSAKPFAQDITVKELQDIIDIIFNKPIKSLEFMLLSGYTLHKNKQMQSAMELSGMGLGPAGPAKSMRLGPPPRALA